MEEKITVLAADANEEYRHQFLQALGTEEDLAVVGETGDGGELLELIQRLQPHVVVMEIVLGSIDALRSWSAWRRWTCCAVPRFLLSPAMPGAAWLIWPPL